VGDVGKCMDLRYSIYGIFIYHAHNNPFITKCIPISYQPETRLICGVDKALSGGLIRRRGLCEVAPSATQLMDGSQKSKTRFRPFTSNSQNSQRTSSDT